MRALTQQLKSGNMGITEVPFPSLGPGQLLIRNYYSVISAGTEGKTVKDARKGYIAKAHGRQKELKQVIDMVRTQGIAETYKIVMNKLDALSSLGYSAAGEIIGIGEGVKGFSLGDFVACGGKDACHAEVVSVGVNLCVKVPENVSMKHAAFATIASIAMQGIRQTELTIGANCVVIGLGLIGQLTLEILETAGIKTIGIDTDANRVEAALKCGLKSFVRDQEGIEQIILQETSGAGTDAVIITAATFSLDPVNLAGVLCRRKGKVVIVGAVPTGFDRANYYKKELDLRMSSSYGPGRYDPDYEEKGIDYPLGYVRWTENRNMLAFIDLLSQKKLDIEKLITHIFTLEESPLAYNLILEKSENMVGILIEYEREKQPNSTVLINNKLYKTNTANVGLIGAGSFAQNILLPRLKHLCNFIGVASAHGNTSRYVADKYKFSYCTDKVSQILEDEFINTVFITTRHNLHSKLIIDCLKAGKNVFVEKPLSLTEKEAKEISCTYESSVSKGVRLMIGYNRRFSPFVQEVKSIYTDHQIKVINIRVNAGLLPADHWVNDSDIGGGRIIGEACHFVDLACFLAGSRLKSVYATGFSENTHSIDTVAINLKFENSSIASISYCANGNKNVSKEYIEIFCNGSIAIIDDFKKLTIFGKKKIIKKSKQDKGHAEELNKFMSSIIEGKTSPIPFEEIFQSSLATFKVLDSINQGRVIYL